MKPAPMLPDLPQGSRLLIIRLRSIGDIILLTPALHMLRAWRPDLRLSVMVEGRFRELLMGNPAVEEILTPDEGAGLGRLFSRFPVIRAIRRRNFALCVNLHGGPTSRLFVRWGGARWRVGFAHYRGASLYHVLVPDARTILQKPSLHTAEHQAAAFFYLGLPRTEIPRAQIFCGATEADWWATKRASLGVTAGHYAIVHPTASYKTKQWSAEGFARIGEYLCERGITPFFSCGPGETSVLDAVEQAAKKPILRLEGMSLSQFAAALTEARIFVGNDSGPAHLAAALSRPVVVIFGSSSSPIWGPWPRLSPGPPARIVQNPFACNPCPGDHCYQFPRPECILSVTFEQVKQVVEEVLAALA